MTFDWIHIVAILYGAWWAFNGLNGFFMWQPVPHVSEQLDEFIAALIKTNFMFQSIKIFQIAAGLFLILNFTLLGLLILAPIIFGIIGLQFKYAKNLRVLSALILIPYAVLWSQQSDFFQIVF